MNPSGPIVLTTDFGLSDYYVGVMKGVILGINPSASIIDLTHQVQPQNISQAAFMLGVSHQYFPPGAIHVAVVDPGVGTERRAILLDTPNARFIAPDNGLLSYVIRDYIDQPPKVHGPIPVPVPCVAYELTSPQFWLHPLSSTFHGRDIFAPVAAHLSKGVPASELGKPVSELEWLPCPVAEWQDGLASGEVIYADHFGNLVTNFPAADFAGITGVVVEIKGHSISGIKRTFHDETGGVETPFIALLGSHGYLEIAVPSGHAASKLKAGVGEPVRVSFQSEA